MSKLKVKYVCSSCGYETLKWLGKCPECDEWNTFSEELVDNKKQAFVSSTTLNVVKLDEVIETEEKRIKTNISEFDRVLGNGFMQGSVVLIGGDPGIGKSTLVMQAASSIEGTVLYVSGEESTTQLNLRAKRLKLDTSNFYVLAVTEMELIQYAIDKINPDVVMIDSIQTMQRAELDNAPGTVTQIRESANHIIQLAKSKNFVAVLIGHITKEGYIAGPKILEHMVDTVLQFEGERIIITEFCVLLKIVLVELTKLAFLKCTMMA